MTSASFRTKWSTPWIRSCPLDGYGPPATTVVPSSLHSRTTRSSDSLWTIMDDVKTTSAADTADGRSRSTFMSTSVTSQSAGRREATVSRPSGGMEAFLPMNGSAYVMLQYVGGISG